jgi:hypothetical protein
MESCSGHECRVKRKGVECSICREKKNIKFKSKGQMTTEDCPKIHEDGSNIKAGIQTVPKV